MNARITLERPSKVPDGAGGGTATWVLVSTIWAVVDEYQSEEMTIAMQPSALKIVKVKIRWREDLKSNWRVGYRGRYFNIMGDPVDIGGNRRWLFFRMKG